MPKSRKSKAKYKDFQKVKLKAGKKLPKGLNETTTAFQSRSIQIREQLKTATDEPTTRRKLNINDLLAHTQHYSISVRHEAVTGLRELFTTAPNAIYSHLPILLDRLAGLCIDKDSAVRQAVWRLFKQMLPHISTNQIAPFFQVLSAHMCCAMTHIDDSIQLDSLKLLDLLLEHYPRLVTSSHSNLLPNFIEQISRQTQTGNSSGVAGGSTGRSLLVNPNSKLSSQKWRLQVLKRLHGFMKAIVDQKSNTAGNNYDDQTRNLVRWTQQTLCCHLVTKPSTSALGNGFLMRSQLNSENASFNALSEGDRLLTTVEILLPLLLQCWVEAGPAQLTTNLAGNVMSIDALSVLDSILGVIRLLLQCVQHQAADQTIITLAWVRQHFMKDFVHYFLPYFPYAMTDRIRSKKEKKIKHDTPQVSVLSLNLAVCEVMTYFLEADDDLSELAWFSQLTDFVTQTLDDFHGNSEDLKVALQILTRISDLKQESEQLGDLLRPAYVLYAGRNALSSDKSILLNFFTDIVLVKHSVSPRLRVIERWMQHLPTHLIQSRCPDNPTTHMLLHTMQQLAAQGHSCFLEALQNHSTGLIDMIKNVGEENYRSQREIFDILFRLPKWECCHLVAVCELIQAGLVSSETTQYMLQTLTYRYQTSSDASDPCINAADYTSFLFSIVIGTSRGILENLQEESPNQDSPFSPYIHMLEDWKYMESGTKVNTAVGDALVQLGNDLQIWQIWMSFLHKIMENFTVLPLLAVQGILHITRRLYRANYDFDEEATLFISNLIGSLLWTVHTVDTVPDSNHNTTSPDMKHFLVSQCKLMMLCRHLFWSDYIGLLTVLKKVSIGRWEVIVRGVTALLHHTDILQVAALHKNLLQDLMAQLEDSLHLDMQNQQWWTDFKYQILIIR